MPFCLIGGTVLTPFRVLDPGVVVVGENLITAVGGEKVRGKGLREIEVGDLLVVPGFIDLHLHGGGGHDVMEGTLDALETIAETHARGGTTAFLATTLTGPMDEIEAALDAIGKACASEDIAGAKILGAHLEGPYLNPEQAGAQNPEYLRIPDPKELENLLKKYPCLKRVTLAPELPGGLESGKLLRAHNVMASIGHSDATYQQVLEAVEAGFSHVTHLFSATSIVRRIKAYRFAGVVEATLLLDALSAELITDGHHLPPSLIRLVVKTKGTDRVCAVTDAISAAGLGPGEYELGGLPIIVESEVPPDFEAQPPAGSYVAKLADRSAFAGSVALMNRVLKTLVDLVGLPLTEAVKMVTWTPARILGISHERGLLAPGMCADLVVLDDAFSVKMTIVEGKIVYQNL
jgi:N-acetylglucosamine-6-phosphate deacetylase